MAQDRLKTWETLFRKALRVIDAATGAVLRPEVWSFGGGTVLMRRHHHRLSMDIDIFVPDPQYLGYVSPELNDEIQALTSRYLQSANFLKLYFDEGEVDFIASGPLTSNPVVIENLFERQVRVDTSAEILAKKIKYRGAEFTARDIFDFAMVAEKEPGALTEIEPIIHERRSVILARIDSADEPLRTVFAKLEVLNYKRSYDECVLIVRKALKA